jgi:threonine dehydrogenase-like Zn-dependent dehydrogenase
MSGPETGIDVKEFPLPDVESRGILVKMEMASICGTDVHILRGRRLVPFPVIAGHEGVGRVYRLGEALKTDAAGNELREGDRVIWSLELTCGDCYYCVIKKDPSACLERKLYGYMSCKDPPHLNGTFSEYIYLRPRSRVLRLPDELSNETAVPAGCALGTAINGLEKVSIEMGDTVLIQGTGPLGLYALALAKEMGAAETIVVSSHKTGPRLELAKSFGADAIVDASKATTSTERIKQVRQLTDGRGPDVIVECTGVPSVIPEGIQMIAHKGRYLLLGTASEALGNISINPANVTLKVLRLIGSRAYETHHLLKGLSFLRRNAATYPFEKMISHKFKLCDVPRALEKYENLEVVKAAIVPWLQ